MANQRRKIRAMATRRPRDLTRDALVRENIRRFREEAGFSQQDLALRTSVPLDAIRRYESGARRAIDAIELQAIATATGHTMDHFFLTDPPPTDPARIPVFAILIDPHAEVGDEMRRELENFVAGLNARYHEESARRQGNANHLGEVPSQKRRPRRAGK